MLRTLACMDMQWVSCCLSVPAPACRQREQKERMEALRRDNVEEYMRLVAGQSGRRNARLDALLGQVGAANWA